jgi:DNA repair and recombination protein RAD52
MTLSSHLIANMDPRKAPIQTPQQPGTRSSANGYHPQPYTATPGPAPMLQGNDGSQFGAHHGTPATPAWHTQGGGGYGMPSPGRFTSWSEERVAMMQSRLQKRLGPEYVTTRPGPSGGGKLR